MFFKNGRGIFSKIKYIIFLNSFIQNLLINLDALYYCSDIKNINEVIRNLNRYYLIKGNLLNKIDKVIYFESQSHVQNSFNVPLIYTHDNIIGIHTLLESYRKYNKIIKFIHISIDKLY